MGRFTDGKGSLLEDYVGAVVRRFERWIVDLCTRDFDDDAKGGWF